MCGSAELAGGATKAGKFTTVRTSQDLANTVDKSPPGTAFWLTRGVHRLGNGKYDQVKPKDGDTFLGAPGAILDGQHRNLYAFGGHASDVTIRYLTVQNFGTRRSTMNEGVVNHDGGHRWTITHSTIRHNGGAGVLLATGSVLKDNCLSSNGQYGFSAYSEDGVRDVVLQHNEIVGNNTADWEGLRSGCGCTGGGKFWATRNAVIRSNWVHGNHGPGIWVDTNNTGFLIEGNYVADNDGQGIMYETSYNALIIHNSFVRNGLAYGRAESGFPTAAIYISESGSDHRAGSRYGRLLKITHNRFIDNWAGVIGWENANRFAGSPANPSQDTTLVSPGVATLRACAKPSLIRSKPYYDDCRWKTQNLRVAHNLFVFRPGKIGKACKRSDSCGFNGLFSNYGTYPSWSPYQGTVVEHDITSEQNNRWESNRYVGAWRFMVLELGNIVDWKTWRGPKYGQDHGSTKK